jgi:TetR/AcrR family transcriptional regulator, transcriptional repressor of bet genes
MTVRGRPVGAKVVSREERRREIVLAAINSISELGYADTTLATVARASGLSQASVVFHFKTKDALLEETLRHVAQEFLANWHRALAKADDDPVSRLMALSMSSFLPKVCNRKLISVWHAFYGESKSRPAYLRICGDMDDFRFAKMQTFVSQVLELSGRSTDSAQDIATVIDDLADGLWLDILISVDETDRKLARRLMLMQLCIIFPEHAAAMEAWELAKG